MELLQFIGINCELLIHDIKMVQVNSDDNTVRFQL